ncbi:MAG: glutathione peroxidase [Candidatus Methylacidiphilales bacterium]|nr:glutathione peroxidase [Candidatus Methylacidiphilales bacterium]
MRNFLIAASLKLAAVTLLLMSSLFSTSNVTAADAPASLYEFKTNTLEGQPVDLATYKGKVVLVVNVASKCGLTKQYTALEKLYETYKDKGFVILGFPCNDFGGQEPGTAEEIQKFCSGKYNVTFPLFEKVSVKGDKISPIYQFLEAGQQVPAWNFHKYLVGKDGKVIESFGSRVVPEDPKIAAAIEAALK